MTILEARQILSSPFRTPAAYNQARSVIIKKLTDREAELWCTIPVTHDDSFLIKVADRCLKPLGEIQALLDDIPRWVKITQETFKAGAASLTFIDQNVSKIQEYLTVLQYCFESMEEDELSENVDNEQEIVKIIRQRLNEVAERQRIS